VRHADGFRGTWRPQRAVTVRLQANKKWSQSDLLAYSNVLSVQASVQHPTPSIEPIQLSDGICHVRPHGACSLVEAAELVNSAIMHCRERRVSKLLFDATDLTGVAIPSLVDRFLMVEEWALAAKSMVAVALVVPAEYIHPEKFGVVVAAHLALTCDVFSLEEKALQWLAELNGSS
jgi:hypothetical protein